MLKRYLVPQELKEIAAIFNNAGFSVYLVGGALRDFFLGKHAFDWDIATNAKPHKVQNLFPRTIPTGIKHGTVTILFKGKSIECTTFRTDSDYSDGRHPDKVNYTGSIEDDLSRRDFTMNAIAAELPSGKIIDPLGGIDDIKAKIIRAVGNPLKRFEEDGLRPIRALRFSAQLGFNIEEKTFKAISLCHEKIRQIAIERFQDEFTKIMRSENPIIGMRPMEETGILKIFIPELAACRGVEQKGRHCFDVLDHLFFACAAAPKDRLHIRLAALFHDIAKPLVRKQNEYGDYTFYNHEIEGEKLTQNILRRLKYPNKLIEQTTLLVRHHMFNHEQIISASAIRRFIVRTGRENIEDLLELRKADSFAQEGLKPDLRALAKFKTRIEKIIAEDSAFSLKDLAVSGNDLIMLGIKRGKKIGIILDKLFETVLDDPSQNKKEQLLKIAENLNKRISDS